MIDSTSIVGKDHPITSAVKDTIAIILISLCLGACQVKVASIAPAGPPAPAARPSESDYQAAPTLSSAVREGGARIRLTGHAGPGDRVRLASPDGQAVYARAGADGVWRVALAVAGGTRLFGLSMVQAGRAVQSEGYIALTPHGTVAQLRSGAGAVVLGDEAAGPVILAVDYDSKGGAVVSGRASPRASLDLWVDGVRRGRGAAGPDGVFSLGLDEPLTFADHHLEIVDGPRRAVADPRLALARPPSVGPYRATQTASGWRIDWLTPGGGLQTTLLPRHDGGGS
jgi:hypothetical protein